MADQNSIVRAPDGTENVFRKAKRGFANMAPDLVRELARKGGVAAHRAGTAHQFTPLEARAAGRKGGLSSHSRVKKSSHESEPI